MSDGVRRFVRIMAGVVGIVLALLLLGWALSSLGDSDTGEHVQQQFEALTWYQQAHLALLAGIAFLLLLGGRNG